MFCIDSVKFQNSRCKTHEMIGRFDGKRQKSTFLSHLKTLADESHEVIPPPNVSIHCHCHCRKCYLMISVQAPSKPSYAKVDASKTVCQASNSFTPDPSVAGSYRCAVLSVTCPKQEVSVYGKGGKIIGKAKFTGVL